MKTVVSIKLAPEGRLLAVDVVVARVNEGAQSLKGRQEGKKPYAFLPNIQAERYFSIFFFVYLYIRKNFFRSGEKHTFYFCFL